MISTRVLAVRTIIILWTELWLESRIISTRFARPTQDCPFWVLNQSLIQPDNCTRYTTALLHVDSGMWIEPAKKAALLGNKPLCAAQSARGLVPHQHGTLLMAVVMGLYQLSARAAASPSDSAHDPGDF